MESSVPPEAPVGFNQMFQPTLYRDANCSWAQARTAGGFGAADILKQVVYTSTRA